MGAIKELAKKVRSRLEERREGKEKERRIEKLKYSQVEEMVAEIKNDAEVVRGIKNPSEKEEALKFFKEKIEGLESFIDDCIKYTKKKNVICIRYGFTRSSKGGNLFRIKKEEISKVKCDLLGGTLYKAEEPEIIYG